MKLGNKKIDWTRLFACVAFATVAIFIIYRINLLYL